jgi:hypothetical protein
MQRQSQPLFHCSDCGAAYQIVRVEALAGPAADRGISCVACGGSLNGREGPFILKYLLAECHRRRRVADNEKRGLLPTDHG